MAMREQDQFIASHTCILSWKKLLILQDILLNYPISHVHVCIPGTVGFMCWRFQLLHLFYIVFPWICIWKVAMSRSKILHSPDDTVKLLSFRGSSVVSNWRATDASKRCQDTNSCLRITVEDLFVATSGGITSFPMHTTKNPLHLFWKWVYKGGRYKTNKEEETSATTQSLYRYAHRYWEKIF